MGIGAGIAGFQLGRQTEPLADMAHVDQQRSDRVVLHISESDPDQFANALEHAERIVRRDTGFNARIDVVANASGIDLMRVGVSPFEDRIRELIRTKDNVFFVACANAIRALRAEGIEPTFMSGVKTNQTAFDHIIGRVSDGWTYVKVESLPTI